MIHLRDQLKLEKHFKEYDKKFKDNYILNN